MKKTIFATLALSMLVSCSEENPEARALLNSAQQAFDNKEYMLANELLDSLQSGLYASALNVQRESMLLRPQVIEQLAIIKMAVVDSMTVVDEADMTRLKPALKWIKAPEMIEGYWIDAKAYKSNFMNSTGIEARVSEIGQFYIVSSANPSLLKHTSITLSTGSASATTQEVSYDGDSNYRIGGGEVITFTPEQSDTIGFFASEQLKNATPAMSLSFNGAKGKKTIKLTAAQAKGIATAYEYSKALVRARDNQVERQRLERTIEIAKNQQEAARQKLEENK